MYKFLAGMLVMAALVALLSKPSRQDAEAELRAQIITGLATEELAGKSGANTAALLACRLDASACADLLTRGIKLTYEDRILFARVALDGFGRTAICYGAFTRFVCPGGLQEK